MRTTQASWYDYPQYFDIAFRSETRAEVRFIEAACRKYCRFAVRRILEPGCGSGRLLTALAARGYKMTGLDLSRRSLAYLRRRLSRRRLEATLLCADMADFRLARPVDAAVNTWNTFRHLTSERAATRHLQCIARALRPGGIYILGFHLLPLDVSEQAMERWRARHGTTSVAVTLRVLATDRRRRTELLRVNLRIRSRRRDLAIRGDFPLRMYTADQFRRLVARVPELELCDVFDFWYQIDQPLELTDELTDAVFILRKR